MAAFGCGACCYAAEHSEGAKGPEWHPSATMMEEGEVIAARPVVARAGAVTATPNAADPDAPVDGDSAKALHFLPSEAFCFGVTLRRNDAASPFGIKFDKSDQRCFEIISIPSHGDCDTPTAVYNRRVEARLQLVPGRFVMSVNSVACSTCLMEKEWTASITVNLSVCEPRRFFIDLEKTEGSRLGIDVVCCKIGRSIILAGITEGLICEWSRHCQPRQQVQLCDRIVAVNGEGMRSEQLLGALKEATGRVRLAISRPLWQEMDSQSEGEWGEADD